MIKCTLCNTEKEDNEFEKQRRQCKECRYKAHYDKWAEYKESDPAFYYSHKMSQWAKSRVTSPSKQSKPCYTNLQTPFGFESSDDMANYIYNNFKDDIILIISHGERPSIDRIDNSIGYCIGNLRVITFKENTDLGVETRRKRVLMITPKGEEIKFESTVKCAAYFGFKSSESSRIASWVRRTSGIKSLKLTPYKLPEGYKFYYISLEN